MRSDTATAAAQLPIELFSEILKNVGADIDTLRNVSLTCQHFHSLARAFIFRRFRVKCGDGSDYGPWDDEDDEDDLALDLSRHSARIDFYSSDTIAQFVRELSIANNILRPEYTDIVNKFFDALPRFTNIQSLSCHGVNVTQLALYHVSTLSSLEHLSVTECRAPAKTDSLPMLRPRTFAGFDYLDEVDKFKVHHWLALLDTDHLQALRAPFTKDSCSFFLGNDNPSVCRFPSLHTLDLEINQEMLPMLPMLLCNTPALRSFKLCPSDLYIRIVEKFMSPTACPLPHLEEYSGPHQLLPIIFGRAMGSQAHLRRLFLESVDEAGKPLDAFMNSFESCHPLHLRDLTHIHISLPKSMDLKSLAKLQDMFPFLQEFYLHSSEKNRQFRRSGSSCEFF
jgi:hypothetical protein